MADEELQMEEMSPEERDAYDEYLAALEGSEEAKAEKEDDKALKVARQTQAVVKDFITDQKIETMTEKFNAEASDDAKALFAIYSHGVDMTDPKAVKRLMDLATTNSASKPEPTDDEVEAMAEEKAAQIAKEDYGVGPVSGRPVQGASPEQVRYDQTFERVQKQGDPLALLELMAEDSPFIDAVLTGKELPKRK